MTVSRQKAKGRRSSGGFIAIPHSVMDSPNWLSCSATAIKMLTELVRQFNGHNNGDLAATLSMLKKRGWSSPETIHFACLELRHYGLIELTRQGGKHVPNLYALSWQPIDDRRGKLDCSATRIASGAWKQSPPAPFKRPAKNRMPVTPSVSNSYAIRNNGASSPAELIRRPH
ncbi:hypothetical protein [Dokdonella immobilis]|uniref:hypothetical protein n=1 Tax=Dokdonella immobilis TaxID=578942 RepID=UPI0011135BBB|nr:hypothetical protein [Dokdonella immobilis]